MYNDDQRDHMRELSERPPETLCWCGWATKGECPNCPPELSCADKMAVWCPECHSAPPATDRSQPITHRKGCIRGDAEWRPIPGFSGDYEISRDGRVRSWKPWRGSNRPLPREMVVQTAGNGRRSIQLGLHGGVHDIDQLLHTVWKVDLPARAHPPLRTNRTEPLRWRRAMLSPQLHDFIVRTLHRLRHAEPGNTLASKAENVLRGAKYVLWRDPMRATEFSDELVTARGRHAAAEAEAERLRGALRHLKGAVEDAQRRLGSVITVPVTRALVVAGEVLDGGQPGCTGVSASWCPACGDCTCPRDEDGGFPEGRDDPGCPLHAPTSRHGEPPSAELPSSFSTRNEEPGGPA